MLHLRATLGAAIILSQAPIATLGAIGTTEPSADAAALCSQVPGNSGRTGGKADGKNGIVVIDGVAPDGSGRKAGENSGIVVIDNKPGTASNPGGNRGIIVIDGKSGTASRPGEESSIGEVDGKPNIGTASGGNNGIIVYGKDDASGRVSEAQCQEPDSGDSKSR